MGLLETRDELSRFKNKPTILHVLYLYSSRDSSTCALTGWFYNTLDMKLNLRST